MIFWWRKVRLILKKASKRWDSVKAIASRIRKDVVNAGLFYYIFRWRKVRLILKKAWKRCESAKN